MKNESFNEFIEMLKINKSLKIVDLGCKNTF